MKKRICAAALAALLLLALCVSAYAAADDGWGSPSAYFRDGTLYAFARFPGYAPKADGAPLTAGLMVNGVQVGEAVTPALLREGEAPVKLLLLLDCSGSMPAYRAQAAAFVEALMGAGMPFEATVAGFGDTFRVLSEPQRDAAGLTAALNRAVMNDQGTDICGGVVYAVNHLLETVWTPGELANIVLITDGEPFYTNNPEQETRSEAEAAKVAQQVLWTSPQVLLHLVSFREWENVTHDALTAGAGLDLRPNSVTEAAESGARLAAYYGGMYGMAFPLSEYSSVLGLRIDSRDILTLPRSGNLTPPDASWFESLPAIIDSEGGVEPEPSPSPAPEETPEPPPEATPSPAPTEMPAPETPAPEETPVPVEASPEPEAPASPQPYPELPPTSAPELLLPLLIGGAVLLAAVIVLLALLLRKRRGNAPAAKTEPPVPADGIPLRLEVLYGGVSGERREYLLSDSLFLGSDARCELVIPEPGVSPVNTRIFRQGNAVYIEDLNSAAGTALGGMRIYTPNPLRPGDEITVGNTVLRFLF